ncbi:hypothetical protein SDC9_122070 [bioreactor metagenome]|uniref:Uncharacterized protein n=1 Tax=bioreactor metagenome TaxID=1076179 RepID=A0A645CDR4_9ZZZZ
MSCFRIVGIKLNICGKNTLCDRTSGVGMRFLKWRFRQYLRSFHGERHITDFVFVPIIVADLLNHINPAILVISQPVNIPVTGKYRLFSVSKADSIPTGMLLDRRIIKSFIFPGIAIGTGE